MTTFADPQAAVETSQQLAAALTEIIRGALDMFVSKATEILVNGGSDPGPVDRVILAAGVQGTLVGVLEFMAARSSEGRMDDPNGHLTTLFTGAAEAWDAIRGTPSGTVETLQ